LRTTTCSYKPERKYTIGRKNLSRKEEKRRQKEEYRQDFNTEPKTGKKKKQKMAGRKTK
jgi:hypothetical protein